MSAPIILAGDVCHNLHYYSKSLSQSPPPRYGACTNAPGSYVCSCTPGWIGQDCNINVDECLATGDGGQNCKNNGTCIDGINSFSCECQPGFMGEFCEIDINECAPTPCQNGAKCVDGINSFSCECTSRFMGPTCNEPYDPCASAPCLNGATCQKEQEERGAGQEYSCVCVPGFQGINCEVGLQASSWIQSNELHIIQIAKCTASIPEQSAFCVVQCQQ